MYLLAAVFSALQTVFRVPLPSEVAEFSAEDSLTTRLARTLAAHGELRAAERRLVIDKSHFSLEARIGDHVLKRYVVNLGPKPFAPKMIQGDGSTPEGRYYVVVKHDSRYYRFFGLSYPAARDAERGVRDGLISRKIADAIRDAERRRAIPDWNTRLGGAIGIHGSGDYAIVDKKAIVENWTLGCIALRNRDIADLENFVSLGIAVDILPASARAER